MHAAAEGEDASAEVQVEDEEPCGWTRDQLHISLERDDSDVGHDSDDRWPRSPSSYSVSLRTSDSELGRRASREEEEQDGENLPSVWSMPSIRGTGLHTREEYLHARKRHSGQFHDL